MINQITSTVLKQYSSLLQERADVVTSSAKPQAPPQITSFSPESSLRVVNDKVIDGIDKELAKNNVGSIRALDPQNFTPESVARGILQFVQNAISRAESRGEATDKMLDQARAGIDKGFSDAKNILTGLNALSSKIAKGVQQTYDLIQFGLQKLGQAQTNISTVDLDMEMAAASQKKQSQPIELTIQTQEGNSVNIQLSQNSALNEYTATLISSASVTNAQTNSTISSNVSLTINGDLNKEEIKSIENLLSKVKTVSDRFFEDDVNAAFEMGFNLGFNFGEIAKFALSINENETQTAAKAYREVSDFSNTQNRISPTQLEGLLKPTREFVTQLKTEVDIDSKSTENLFNFFSRTNENNANQIERIESLTASSFEVITDQLISSTR